jgi:hypothetical protein
MRLINVHTLEFRHFSDDCIPPYAIASHRWGEEISMKDVQKKRNEEKDGFIKLKGFAKFVKVHIPTIQWLWLDTCCIDRSSSQEVSEAVNTMFKWYRRSAVCLAYLKDVKDAGNLEQMRGSVWFTRGWILQELVAPRLVLFLTRDWDVVGHKGNFDGTPGPLNISAGLLLHSMITKITDIPEFILEDYDHAGRLSVEERFAWTKGRETTKAEDLSYCLFGIFDVSLPIIYGEGEGNARECLMAELSRGSEELKASRIRNEQRAKIIIESLDYLERTRRKKGIKEASADNFS